MRFFLLLFAFFSLTVNASYDPRLMYPRIAGESYWPGTATCLWPRTSTTVGAFTAVAACPGPTIVFSFMGTWSTTDTNLPSQTITGLPKGVYKATFRTYQYMSAINDAALAINDGTTTCEAVGAHSTTVETGTVVSCIFSYAAAGTRTFELYGASAAGTINIFNALVTPRVSTKFTLEYWGPL